MKAVVMREHAMQVEQLADPQPGPGRRVLVRTPGSRYLRLRTRICSTHRESAAGFPARWYPAVIRSRPRRGVRP